MSRTKIVNYMVAFCLLTLFSLTCTANGTEDDYFMRVLDAALAESTGGMPETTDKLYELNEKSQNREQALIDLLDYYIGSAAGAMLDDYISASGNSIITRLERKRAQNVRCMAGYERICTRSSDHRNKRIDHLIQTIKDNQKRE